MKQVLSRVALAILKETIPSLLVSIGRVEQANVLKVLPDNISAEIARTKLFKLIDKVADMHKKETTLNYSKNQFMYRQETLKLIVLLYNLFSLYLIRNRLLNLGGSADDPELIKLDSMIANCLNDCGEGYRRIGALMLDRSASETVTLH